MGEFGWKEILKQFLEEETAAPIAAGWDGDRYALYEQKQTKRLILVARFRLDSADQAGHFYEAYSELLAKKYAKRENIENLPNFLSFDTVDGGVFLRCVASECLSVEGATRAKFDEINRLMGWPGVPEAPKAGVSEHP